MNRMLLLLFFLGLFSCKEETRSVDSNPTEAVQLNDTLEVQSNRRVNLLPEAQEQVGEWLAYATAHNQVEDLRTATGRELISSSQPLVQIMQNLSRTLPDTLRQTAVIARTTVLLTKANQLHQVSNKKDIRVQEVFEAANDIILEFGNFKLQLNEIFLKTPKDFETELDLQFEENQDSLRKVRERRPVQLKTLESSTQE